VPRKLVKGKSEVRATDCHIRHFGHITPAGRAWVAAMASGGFIHAKDQKSRGEGWFEVIAGKSMPEEAVSRERQAGCSLRVEDGRARVSNRKSEKGLSS
jgi:hypothetical protein